MPRLLTVVVLAASCSSGSILAAAKPKAPAPLAAEGAVQVTEAELDALVGNKAVRFRTEEYQMKRAILEEHLGKLLLEREAASRKTTVPELVQAEVDAKAAPVKDEEARAVYDSAKERFGGMSEDAAVAQIASGMKGRRNAQRRAEYIKELKAKAGVKIRLEPPRVDVAADDGVAKGEASAVVTVVEYSDYQCPYCAQSASTMKKVAEKYKDKVSLVYRDYPLPFHKEAPKAAEAAHCAREQGKFWEMHDSLFSNQKALAVADLKRYGGEIGLETVAFAQCLDSGRHEKTWRASMKLGESFGVGSTPTLFVNGRVVGGAVPFDVFEGIVEEELERAASGSGRVVGTAKGTTSK